MSTLITFSERRYEQTDTQRFTTAAMEGIKAIEVQ